MTPIDISTCTVASDGLTFTITGAIAGEYYDYGWYYDSSVSTVPSVTITCASDLKGAVDETVKAVGRVSGDVDRVQDEVTVLSKQIIKAYATKADCTIKGAGTQIMAVDLNYKVLTWDGTAWRDAMGTVVA